MKAKVSLLARVNDGTGAFPQIPAAIYRRAILMPVQRKSDGRSFGLKDIIGFYARYPENGKRKFSRLEKTQWQLTPSSPKLNRTSPAFRRVFCR